MKNNFLIIFILIVISISVLGYFDLFGFIKDSLLGTNEAPQIATRKIVPREKQIIVATVGSPNDLRRGYREFIDYVASELSEYGIVQGVATTSSSASEMANKMRLNKADIYIDSVFTSSIISKLTNSPIVAVKWEGGEDKYNSVIFVQSTSTIKKISDVEGKKIAFHEPYSTSAYFLPKSELLKNGFSLNELVNSEVLIATSSINYYFTRNDIEVYNAVISGEADAGALSELALKRFAGKDIKDIVIIKKTPDVYRSVVILNSNLSPELRQAIETILLTMGSTTEGKKALKVFHQTSKFTKIEDNDPLMTPLVSLSSFLEKEIIQR